MDEIAIGDRVRFLVEIPTMFGIIVPRDYWQATVTGFGDFKGMPTVRVFLRDMATASMEVFAHEVVRVPIP